MQRAQGLGAGAERGHLQLFGGQRDHHFGVTLNER